MVLDVAGQHVKAVDLGGQFAGERGAGFVPGLGHFARGAGVVRADLALDAVIFQEARALRQNDHMAVRLGHIGQFGAFDAQKVDMHPHERLVHDVQPGLGQERMDVCHPAIGGIFHRQHAQIDRAGAGHLDHIFKGLAGNRGEIRPRLRAGLMRIGPKFPLESDATRHFGRLP